MTNRFPKQLLIFWFALLLPAAFCLSPLRAAAHTYHTSLTRIDFNDKEKIAEITIQTFSHDLEDALAKQNGKRINLDKSPDIDKILLKYLSSQFVLKNRKNEAVQFRYVGKETQTDAVFIYVEAPLPEGFDGATLENRVLFEMFDDQVNLVTCHYADKKNDLVFRPNDKAQNLIKIE